MMGKFDVMGVVVVLGMLAIGCGDDGEGSAKGEQCQAWRDAYCRLEAKCGVDAAACQVEVSDIQCAPEHDVSSCPAALDGWQSCTTVPRGCGLQSVADTAAAQAACDELVSEGCNHWIECGTEPSEAACVSGLKDRGLDCSLALGETPSYASCRAKLKELTCSGSLPDECADAIRLSDP